MSKHQGSEEVFEDSRTSGSGPLDVKSSRRAFLQASALALGALGLPARSVGETSEGVALIADPADAVASLPSCKWARTEVVSALQEHGIKTGEYSSLQQSPPGSFCIVASGPACGLATNKWSQAGLAPPNGPESLALFPFFERGQSGIVACGEARGLLYALLELADRIRLSDQPLSALKYQQALAERPFNSLRSIGRIFCSDIEDKPWFYDREMWPAYFSMLATQRYNRFSLNVGIGYDSLEEVRDAYLLFAYPFLLAVPGYNVRAVDLPDSERDRNLEMLQFISAQAVAHGLDFQLGIWTHGYHWGPGSQPNYTIQGLTPDNHAAYSRDALTALLKVCPDISGVTLRTHGESGVREGSYAFWSTVFSALPACGRKVNLDLHTKGLNQQLIDAALKTEMPLTLSPKYWAEHMGLPYQQASIRDLEMPHEDRKVETFYSLSNGTRSFTRYGYADFLRENRPYRVMFRIWPGSHRLLLWGDPSSTAAHARAFNFCGCDGVELYEPLTFKGRRGSGIAGGRCAYADKSLEPGWDWEKYLYTYRSWGRLLYNPDAEPDVWRRYLQKQFGAAAPAMEGALSSATPITQIITTAHLPSAANDAFSPEYYTNQSIVDASAPSPYFDTPAPRVFGNVSPLDPQLFSTISEFAADSLEKQRSGKYTPLEVAQWLDAAADAAAAHLEQAGAKVSDNASPEFRRAAVDLTIEIGIGRFFASKFRSGVLYAAYELSGDRAALEEALKRYRHAYDIWKAFAETARGVYSADITYGPRPHQRANWLDRLPAIEEDLAEMEKRLQTTSAASHSKTKVSVRDFSEPMKRERASVQHTPPDTFVPGRPLEIVLNVPSNVAHSVKVRLYYRHVNQAERYQSTEMHTGGKSLAATIPAIYTNSTYPLQYYFELRRGSENAWLHPGLGIDLRAQPYFVVRPASPSKPKP